MYNDHSMFPKLGCMLCDLANTILRETMPTHSPDLKSATNRQTRSVCGLAGVLDMISIMHGLPVGKLVASALHDNS